MNQLAAKLCFLVCLMLATPSAGDGHRAEKKEHLVQVTIKVLTKSADFHLKQYKQQTVDSLFCLRACQGW